MASSSLNLLEFVWNEIKPEAQKISKLSPDFEKLVEKNFDLNLNELLSINHKKNQTILAFLCSLIVYRIKEEAPLGEKGLKFSEYFEYLYGLNLPCKNSIFLEYSSYLASEISACPDIRSLFQWAKEVNKLSFTGEDLSMLKNSLRLNFTKFMWESINDTTNPSSNNKIMEFIKNLYIIQSFNIEIQDLLSFSISNICSYIETENDIDRFEEYHKQSMKKDKEFAKKLLGAIQKLRLEGNKNLKERIENLAAIYCKTEQNPEHKDRVPKEISEIKNQIDIDFSKFIHTETIYANYHHPLFGVVVYKAIHKDLGIVVIKEYTAKISLQDLKRFQSEIDIMSKLSLLASPKNCFLKYYGSYTNMNKIYLVMEHANNNLMNTITYYKSRKIKIQEPLFPVIFGKLLNSFALMESNKIYHQDIKPHNIIVDDEFNMKIIDFSISEIKNCIDTTLVTEDYYIQGTRGYMAPELQDAIDSGKSIAKYKRGKADVFS